jgi:type IV secretory pathway TraG/TraD family ATPase VirD4
MGLPARAESSFIQAAPDRDFLRELDAPLLKLGKDNWTLGQACEGALILGATGSGKSSGSGATIARAFLRAGMGGLVLCAKPSERETWERYAKECGRSESVIVFDGSGRERFNFLEYELRRGGAGSGETFNIVQLFMQIMETSNRRKGGGEGAGDSFWQDNAKMLLSNVVDALIAAYGTVRLGDVVRFIDTMPTADNKRETEFCITTLYKARENPAQPLSPHDFQVVSDFICKGFRTIADKTRSGIIAHLVGMAHPFLKGRMHELFCTNTTLCPEMTHEGAIIIVDLPLKTWESTGIIAQSMFKYLWQKATERRNVQANPRPVFLYCDEAQFFLSDYDNEFQSTARSARAATVYLTQNLSGIYASIGGKNTEHVGNALMGNLRTKILHSNDDFTTNQWAANLLGKVLHRRKNWNRGNNSSRSVGESEGTSWNSGGSSSSAPMGGGTSGSNWGRGRNRGISLTNSTGASTGEGESEQMDYRIQPNFFAERLRIGGTANKLLVDGLIFQPTRQFNTGENFTLCSFPQA